MVDRKSTISEQTAVQPHIRGGNCDETTGPIAADGRRMVGAGVARPVFAATKTASVNANVVKPLTLVLVQNLDLGTVALGPGTFASANVGISKSGVFTCASANLICTGATQVAKYKVTGTNKQTVLISTPNVTLVNQADCRRR